MISLKQDTMDIGGLVSILNRYGDTEVKLNLELLNADYEKYSNSLLEKEAFGTADKIKILYKYISNPWLIF